MAAADVDNEQAKLIPSAQARFDVIDELLHTIRVAPKYPVDFPPGSDGKIAVLIARYHLGLPMHVEGDASDKYEGMDTPEGHIGGRMAGRHNGQSSTARPKPNGGAPRTVSYRGPSTSKRLSD